MKGRVNPYTKIFDLFEKKIPQTCHLTFIPTPAQKSSLNFSYYVLQPIRARIKRLAAENKQRTLDILSQSEAALKSHPSILHVERERVLKRTKRDFQPNFQTLLDERTHRNQQLQKRVC